MFEQKITEHILNHELIPKNSKVVAGVSGGPDSLVMLHFLRSIQVKFEFELIVAHVDHMFRGEESYGDYLFVEKVCKEWNIPFEGRRIDVPSHIQKTGESTQLTSRKLRFAFYEEVMKRHSSSILALGHHGDDQIETMLMRMTRGASGLARAGISVKRPFNGGFIIRPLLVVNKEEIEEYANRFGLIPRIDPSNAKDDYLRNRFRHRILPFLKQENPSVHEQFQRFSEELTEDERFLQELAIAQMERVWIEKNQTNSSIDIEFILLKPKPLQRRVIQLILNYLYIDRPSSLSAIHIDQLLALFLNPQPSVELHLPEGLIAGKSYGICTFRFSKIQDLEYALILHIPGETILPNGYKIKAQYIKEDRPYITGNDSFIFSTCKTSLPLTARTRRNGDRMDVKGLKGTKKLKDIFINEKIPMLQRNVWPVVTDQTGTIIWLPGLKKSNLECVDRKDESSLVYLEYKKA